MPLIALHSADGNILYQLTHPPAADYPGPRTLPLLNMGKVGNVERYARV